MRQRTSTTRRVLWVGAFPPADSPIIGGFVTSCQLLLRSTFVNRVALTLVDGTQPNNPAPRVVKRVWLAASRLVRYLARFERTRPDAVLLFASSTQLSVAEKGLMGWYARMRGSAVLLFPRGGAVLDAGRDSPRMARWLRRVFGSAHVVLCQGPAWHEFVTDILGFAPTSAPIVPNWTATPEHTAIGEARRTQLVTNPDTVVRLLFVGWVNREKGTFELLEACRRLSASYQFRVNLVGDGVAADEIRRLISEYGLEDCVRISGWLRGEELLRAFEDADVFVLPSWAEGLPNAMIEAMASGLAIVVSAVGAIPGLVTDGDQALLVAPRDPADLAAALERLIRDPQLRRRMGERASTWAAKLFGVEPAVDRLITAIEQAIVLSRGGTCDRIPVRASSQTVRGEHA